MAPNTAAPTTIASADTIAARRMADLQTPMTPQDGKAEPRPKTADPTCHVNPILSGQFEAVSTEPAIFACKNHRLWQSCQLGTPFGSALASNTARATARASVLAAMAPSSVTSLTASASGRRPVAAAKTVSPSSVVCAG